ncbi:MAG: hypothetical protein HY907_02335 [Deltaproteobacteria bacterium]|nr:hypothetical protein [Deltaproteobacteria bacterium]
MTGKAIPLALVVIACGAGPAAGPAGGPFASSTDATASPPNGEAVGDERGWERHIVEVVGDDPGPPISSVAHLVGSAYFAPDDRLGRRSDDAIAAAIAVASGWRAESAIAVEVWVGATRSEPDDAASSVRRAYTFARSLVAGGIDCRRITAIGHGRILAAAVGALPTVMVSETTRAPDGSLPVRGTRADSCSSSFALEPSDGS